MSNINNSANNIDVSVIIVNWNAGNYLKQTINSLLEQTKELNYEVIVLDNLSNQSDISYKYMKEELELFDHVNVIFNDDNLGFAKANNKGMDIAKGRNILLLNPDVIVKNNMVKILSDYLDHHDDVAIIGPKVLNIDETFQTPCMRGEPYPIYVLAHLSGLAGIFKNNEKINKFALNHYNRDNIQTVAGLSGCCMMIKKSVIDLVGKMDEQFFMYQEETDWCWRIHNANWKLIYNPEAVIIHDRGATTKKRIFKSNYIFTLSMMKFFKKHHFKRYNLVQITFFTILIWSNLILKNIKTYISLLTKKNSDLNYSDID